MSLYTYKSRSYEISYNPKKLTLGVSAPGRVWSWTGDAYIEIAGSRVSLEGKYISSSERKTGVGVEFKAEYRGFSDKCDLADLALITTVSVNFESEELIFECRLENEPDNAVQRIAWPKPFAFGAGEGEGYTVLSRMQGSIIPAKYEKTLSGGSWDGIIFERDSYMPVYGQVVSSNGYVMIYDTPYDALYNIDHEPYGDTLIRPIWIPEMNSIRYNRRIICVFRNDGSGYVGLMKEYRKYLIENGIFVSLEEKIARNKNVAYLLGAPVVHTGIAATISPKSNYYHKDEPEKNEWSTPFSQRLDELRALKENGADKVYLHLDGWGKHGYDNLHPDVFPVNEKAGGAAGMKRLSDGCRELGYRFGIHDQYRDYYYDGDSFDIKNAAMQQDGSYPYCSIWYGGEQTVLCQKLAPDYVRRNYNEFERLGIQIDGSYLDVFSVVYLDRCFDPDHPMTRRESAEYRRCCLDILTSRGIIPSSEETTDCIVPSLALCHHAPYFTNLGNPEHEHFGIPVPLFNLVWHDSIVIPWSSQVKRGDWGMPRNDWGLLHSLLNGDTCYLSITADKAEIEQSKIVLRLHKRIAALEMLSHEFIDGDVSRQRSVFADGTEVEVNFKTDEYSIR